MCSSSAVLFSSCAQHVLISSAITQLSYRFIPCLHVFSACSHHVFSMCFYHVFAMCLHALLMTCDLAELPETHPRSAIHTRHPSNPSIRLINKHQFSVLSYTGFLFSVTLVVCSLSHESHVFVTPVSSLLSRSQSVS